MLINYPLKYNNKVTKRCNLENLVELDLRDGDLEWDLVVRRRLGAGKLTLALLPRMRRASSSYARAASSAVLKVPSQTRTPFCGSRISAAHFPHGLCLIPLYWFFLFLLLSDSSADLKPIDPSASAEIRENFTCK